MVNMKTEEYVHGSYKNPVNPVQVKYRARPRNCKEGQGVSRWTM